jgi:signal transduction histidine kinase/ligand-binding sensor domain-containing protein/CheY-like chemotaxis protein/methylphosphotriester-DNA--protein-cysteine methyltransferase
MRLDRVVRRAVVRLCAISALLHLGGAPHAAAQRVSAGDDAPGFRIDRWTTDDGLPSHTITSLTQTRDGYLWLATAGGLVRFDGSAFTVYTSGNSPGFPPNRADIVYGGSGDTLWIATARYGVFSFVGGRFHQRASDSTNVRYVVQDGRGRLYGGASRLFQRGDSGWRAMGTSRTVASFPLLQPQAARDETGTVWIAGDNGHSLYRVTERGLERAMESRAPIVVTAPSRNEVFAVQARGDRLYIVDKAGAVRASCIRRSGSVPRLIDARGTLWVTTREGIEAYISGVDTPIAHFVLPRSTATVAMIEDREGNIWAGTSQQGLWRIQRTAFRVVGMPEGFRQEQVASLWRGADGAVLATDATLALFRVESHRAAPLSMRAPSGLPGADGPRGAAYLDSRGTLWVGWGRLDAQGALVGRRAGAADIVIQRMRTPVQIIEDPTRPGVLWVHDRAQIYRVAPYSGVDQTSARKTWGVGGTIRDMAIDREGTAWLAGYSSGTARLIRVANDSVRLFTSADGLPANELRAVVVDRDDVVWIGTYGAGIVRYKDGEFRSVTTRDGLAEDVVSSILFDDADRVWMSGNRGVHRTSRDELNAFLDRAVKRVHSVAYTRRDGLRNPEASGHAAARATDGRMWFPTYDGAAVVDPAFAVSLDSVPPLVRIERVIANGDSVSVDSAARLPRGQRRLQFTYTGIGLRNAAAMRFEYRLEGVDPEWVDAGTSRAAVYNHVGPGRYAFHVRATNAGGVSSAEDAVLSVGVPAYFYETTPFALAVALTLLGVAYGGHRVRVRDLERRRVELNRIVDERTAALEAEKRRTESTLLTVSAQAEQLRTVDESKSRFFANVSHEFRTPLSLILGPLNDIRDGRTGPLSEPAQRKLDTMAANAQRLVRLVDQLLDIARLEANAVRLHSEVHDLVAYLRRTAEAFASMADRRRIQLVVAMPVGGIRVRFDSDQMDKVCANLLGNAFKFTPAGGRIELRAHVETNGADGGWAVVSVADTGAGIPADHLPRVFDRFYQVDDSARREHEGAGIGLALTKELVELHGGRIAVESTPGAGTTFTVRLPIAAGDTAPIDAKPRRAAVDDAVSAEVESGPLGARTPAALNDAPDVTTVLLVEDNAELRAYLREHLETRYRVLEAKDGAEGLAIARAQVPDLVVSDIMMPNMDGQALCEAIKGDAEIDFVPVILLTAKASRESRLAGLEIGADDYLTKPVDLPELLVRANNLISSRRRLRERFREEARALPTVAVPMLAAPFDQHAEAFARDLYAAFAKHIGEEDLDVDVLARALSISRRTLFRKAEAIIGRSPMDALREYRLDQAAQWLRETDALVSEVAYGVGFRSVPHFCSRFHERFGATPSAFRAAARPSAG